MDSAIIRNKQRACEVGLKQKKHDLLWADLHSALYLAACEISVGKTSFITRKGLDMTEHVAIATEAMEAALAAFSKQHKLFSDATDNMVSKSKQKVSQITDYNNRLATALTNLNKTLGDERMVRALENAEKLSTALALLDRLEQSGSLAKIMAALAPSK